MSGWRDHITIHPAADVFPLLPKNELQELADDISKNGLLEGVTLWLNPVTGREELLDGRNRLDALELLGDEIVNGKGTVRKEWYGKTYLTGMDPASYVIGRNIRRRHLTKRKQAELIVAAVLAGKKDRARPARSLGPPKGQKGGGGSTKDPVKAQVLEEAAKAGISERTVRQALVDAEPERKRGRPQKAPKPPDEVQAVLFELIDQQAATLAKLGHGHVRVETTVTFADGTMIRRRADA